MDMSTNENSGEKLVKEKLIAIASLKPSGQMQLPKEARLYLGVFGKRTKLLVYIVEGEDKKLVLKPIEE